MRFAGDYRVAFHSKLKQLNIKTLPLGNLIERFRRVSDNQALITTLHTFKQERDYVAHRSIAEYMSDKTSSPKSHRALMKRLKTMEDLGYQLFDALNAEQDSFDRATRTKSLSEALAEHAARSKVKKDKG